jgi:hypothetical protein
VFDNELSQMSERHIKEALAFQQKVIEKLRQLKPEDLSTTDLARYFDLAVKVERSGRELLAQQAQEENDEPDDQLGQHILDDPDVAQAACRLLAAIAACNARARRPGPCSDQWPMDLGQPPRLA